jgi:PucR C-terminal helix-turn-helix domain/GGDEF-like domain
VRSVEDARAALAERLRARRDELVEAIMARIRDGVGDHTGAQDAEYVAGLRSTVVAVLEYVLDGIERGSGEEGAVPVVVLEQARRASRVGVSLDTVLRRYVVGSALLGEFVMDEGDRDEHPDGRRALREAVRVQSAALDSVLETITREYRHELASAGRSPQQRRAEHVMSLLAGASVANPQLDYQLDGWHLGVIAMGSGATQAVPELARRAGRRLLSVAQTADCVWAWLGGKDRISPQQLEPVAASIVTGQNVILALGEAASGLQGWRATHQQARAAIEVALRRPKPITRYGDVALLATALKDEALAGALTEIFISPLDDARNRGPVLRQTLRAYLAAERNASSAAIMLRVSRSTVESRLRTVEAKVGRTLHPCPAELEVALELDELSPLEP